MELFYVINIATLLIAGLIYLKLKEVLKMAAGIQELSASITELKTNLQSVETKTDAAFTRLTDKIAALEAQIGQGGTPVDLQPYVDEIKTAAAELLTLAAVADSK